MDIILSACNWVSTISTVDKFRPFEAWADMMAQMKSENPIKQEWIPTQNQYQSYHAERIGYHPQFCGVRFKVGASKK